MKTKETKYVITNFIGMRFYSENEDRRTPVYDVSLATLYDKEEAIHILENNKYTHYFLVWGFCKVMEVKISYEFRKVKVFELCVNYH